MKKSFQYINFFVVLLFLTCKEKTSISEKPQEETQGFLNNKENLILTRVQPAKIYASNVLEPGVNYSYEPENAFDGKINTTWAIKGFSGLVELPEQI